MGINYTLLFILTVVCRSYGDVGHLRGFLSEAHQHFHNKINEVSGAVLGGLTHGINLNIEGHVDIGQTQPATQTQHPQTNTFGNSGQDETVIVIVEETSQDNSGQPNKPQNHHGYGLPSNEYRPIHTHGYRPHNHGYYGPPNNNGYGFPNHRPPGHGHHGHGYNLPNYGFNHGYHNGQDNNNYGNRPHNNPSYNHREDLPNNNHNGYPNLNDNSYSNEPIHQGSQNPTTDNANKYPKPELNSNGNYKPTEASNDQQNGNVYKTENPQNGGSDKSTKKPEEDGPLFVPLDQYQYGDGHINVNAPKRETDKTKPSTTEEEEDFPIDIRIKDE